MKLENNNLQQLISQPVKYSSTQPKTPQKDAPLKNTIDKQIRIGFCQRKSEDRLWRRLCIFKRRRTPPYPYRIQATVLIVKKRRESAYSHFHYAKNMGRCMGKQRCFPARIYGDFAQKNRTVRRFAAIYSNSRRYRVQNDKD